MEHSVNMFDFEKSPTSDKSEEQFRMLVESVRDYAIFKLDSCGHVVTWNSGAERIKGYKSEEVIGRHFSCFYTSEDLSRGKPAQELEAARAEGRYEDEGWRIRKDRSLFWANVIITAIVDEAGELHGFVKVTRDLTERKRAEDALRASHDELEQRVQERTAELVRLNEQLRSSEERYRLMIEGVTDYAIYTLDPTGRITSWNDGAERIYGYVFDEIVGQHRSLFFTPEDIAQGLPQRELTEAAAQGKFSEEAWRVRKGGSTFWANGTITALKNEDGTLRGFVKVVRDLTERKRAETQLQKTLAALNLRDRAIRAVSHGVFITDPHQSGNPLIYVSPGFEKLTGHRSEEVLGKNLNFLIGPKTDEAVVKKVEEAIAVEQESVVEIINYRKDGTVFWSEQTISPVRDDSGKLIHFVGVQADATQRRNLEEQLRQSQKMDAIGRLAGGVAHDFNNLLTVIFGYCESLLVELSPRDPGRSSVEAIEEAATRAADLTRQLLTVSRGSVDKPQLVNLNRLIEDTERLLRRMIREDVLLTTSLDPDIGPLKVDPSQIGQILMNLIVNARDAMPKGGQLTITTKKIVLDEPYVNTHVEVAAGQYVLLAVSDTGSGMTPEVRSRIFDPFFTTKPAGQGTGLGLSVVHGIVKQSHGHIGAYTELGVGTTFKIYLPAVGQEAAIPGNSRQLETIPRGSETVLLVEDEERVRAITLTVLKNNGYHVLVAKNGDDAVRVLSECKGKIDLLLTDVVMPEMNGSRLAELVKSRIPGIKVLFMSGFTDDAVVRHGLLTAESAFIQKPFTSMGLLKKVRQVLEVRQ